MNKALFIIPFYNEEKRMPHQEFVQCFKEFDFVDFLLVDDGSSDGTSLLLKDLAAKFVNISALHLEKNQGKAQAIRSGIFHNIDLNYDYFGYLDADLSTPISEVVALFDFAKANPHLKVIMGTRIKLLGNTIIRSSRRHYLGRIFATIISRFILKTAVYDTQCGAKIIRSDTTQLLFKDKFETRWLFDVEMLLRLKASTGNLENQVAEVPLNIWVEKGGTKIKFIEFIKFPFEIGKIYFKNGR